MSYLTLTKRRPKQLTINEAPQSLQGAGHIAGIHSYAAAERGSRMPPRAAHGVRA